MPLSARRHWHVRLRAPNHYFITGCRPVIGSYELPDYTADGSWTPITYDSQSLASYPARTKIATRTWWAVAGRTQGADGSGSHGCAPPVITQSGRTSGPQCEPLPTLLQKVCGPGGTLFPGIPGSHGPSGHSPQPCAKGTASAIGASAIPAPKRSGTTAPMDAFVHPVFTLIPSL